MSFKSTLQFFEKFDFLTTLPLYLPTTDFSFLTAFWEYQVVFEGTYDSILKRFTAFNLSEN